MAFSGLYGMQAWICRLSNIVGARSTHGIILDLLEKLKVNADELEVLGDGTQTKPYMYVHEIVEALLFIRANSDERLTFSTSDRATPRPWQRSPSPRNS